MSEENIIELNPILKITADAIGAPGERVFYVQGSTETQVISLIIEKYQLQTLSIGVEQFLGDIRQRNPMLIEASDAYDEIDMKLSAPIDPLFRVSEFGLSYDPENDLIALVAREIPSQSDEQGIIVRFWCSRSQVRKMINHGGDVTEQGRLSCPQCAQPMDPAGHFCARKNGHVY
jgi:uncharacterized repeat protein (TIGR03847 family)